MRSGEPLYRAPDFGTMCDVRDWGGAGTGEHDDVGIIQKAAEQADIAGVPLGFMGDATYLCGSGLQPPRGAHWVQGSKATIAGHKDGVYAGEALLQVVAPGFFFQSFGGWFDGGGHWDAEGHTDPSEPSPDAGVGHAIRLNDFFEEVNDIVLWMPKARNFWSSHIFANEIAARGYNNIYIYRPQGIDTTFGVVTIEIPNSSKFHVIDPHYAAGESYRTCRTAISIDRNSRDVHVVGGHLHYYRYGLGFASCIGCTAEGVTASGQTSLDDGDITSASFHIEVTTHDMVSYGETEMVTLTNCTGGNTPGFGLEVLTDSVNTELFQISATGMQLKDVGTGVYVQDNVNYWNIEAQIRNAEKHGASFDGSFGTYSIKVDGAGWDGIRDAGRHNFGRDIIVNNPALHGLVNGGYIDEDDVLQLVNFAGIRMIGEHGQIDGFRVLNDGGLPFDHSILSTGTATNQIRNGKISTAGASGIVTTGLSEFWNIERLDTGAEWFDQKNFLISAGGVYRPQRGAAGHYQGAGAPGALSAPNGSIYSDNSGAGGFYVRQGGAWVLK